MLQHGPTVAFIFEKIERRRLGRFKPVENGAGRYDPAHRIEHGHYRRPEVCDAGVLFTNSQRAVKKSIVPV